MRSLMTAWQELVALVPPWATRVLEVGGRPRRVGGAVQRRLPGAAVTTIDLLGLAADGADWAAVVHDPATGRPFTEPFDAVIVRDVLGRVADPRPLLAAVRPLLGLD